MLKYESTSDWNLKDKLVPLDLPQRRVSITIPSAISVSRRTSFATEKLPFIDEARQPTSGNRSHGRKASLKGLNRQNSGKISLVPISRRGSNVSAATSMTSLVSTPLKTPTTSIWDLKPTSTFDELMAEMKIEKIQHSSEIADIDESYIFERKKQRARKAVDKMDLELSDEERDYYIEVITL